MKGAINYSDRIIAVSPKYAEEILTSEFGEGMDYTLRGQTHKIRGILNGIDYEAFNPKKDKNLVKNYDVKSLKNKEANKKKVCEFFGLKYNPDRPLIAMISRLVPQKGLDLIRQVENELKYLDADFVFLGSGDKDYENLLIWHSNNSNNIRSYIGYKADLANLIYAGSDFFLMPSAFEPCGLSQLIAMRYGCLPIVRATGGLDNTVVGYPLDNSTGFKFWNYDANGFLNTIRWAMDTFKDKKAWNKLVKNAMSQDFSWQVSAQKYIWLYEDACGLK
jgi:starch synthase